VDSIYDKTVAVMGFNQPLITDCPEKICEKGLASGIGECCSYDIQAGFCGGLNDLLTHREQRAAT
jgi:hypothetical protein